MALPACSDDALNVTATGLPPAAPTLTTLVTSPAPTTPTVAITRSTRVAPIFTHGRGYGQCAWDANEGAVLLSKEEACADIMEIARAAGLHFTQDAPTLLDILPVQGRAENESLPAPMRSLTLDGCDTQRHIAFVFVSAADANNFRKPFGNGSLGEGVDIYSCALSLRDTIAGAPLDGYYAVFYDPAISLADVPPAMANEQNEQTVGDLLSQANEYAHMQLRQQVRDFIDWLKTQPGFTP